MSNPFDQFSSALQEALPPGAQPTQNPEPEFPSQLTMGPPMSAPAPAAAPKSVMNAPPQQTYANYGAQQPQYGAPQPGYGAPSPYGAPPQPYGQPAYGAAPEPQAAYGQSPFGEAPAAAPPAPTDNVFGGYGQPPAAPTPQPPAAPEPAAFPGPDAGSVAGSTGAPPAQDNPFGAPPPTTPQPNYGAPPPTTTPQPSYGAPPPTTPQSNYGAPPPYGAPEQQSPYGAPPPQPYGAAPEQSYGSLPSDQSSNAMVPAAQQANPYALSPQPAYGAPPPQQQPPAAVDPFSVFNSAPAPPPAAPTPAPQQQQLAVVPQNVPTADEDFWGDFGSPSPATAAAPAGPPQPGPNAAGAPTTGADGLPEGGSYYDAKIFTPTLGVMFFKPQELTDSLFLNTDKGLVDALGERPVVAFIVEGSSARAAGVELGHVLLKVNGIDVQNPKDASRLIKEGPRPLPLLFYVPDTDVVVAEGEHMVKYDTRDTAAPNSAKDWKPKYVVIGGIIAQPWMMNMYRSKVGL